VRVGTVVPGTVGRDCGLDNAMVPFVTTQYENEINRWMRCVHNSKSTSSSLVLRFSGVWRLPTRTTYIHMYSIIKPRQPQVRRSTQVY
jgi:hypothetical protein